MRSEISCSLLKVSVFMLLAVCLSGNALAKNNNEAPKQQRISVISHITLPGTPAKEMMLQQQNGGEYLYLLRSSGNGFTVVDVTKPDKPSLVRKLTVQPGMSTHDLDVGNSMAIAEQSLNNSQTSRSMKQPESIQVMDMSDPANPRPLETFNGVTSVLTEDGRRLVYISNDERLWILRRPSKPTTHPCTSSDEIAGYTECE